MITESPSAISTATSSRYVHSVDFPSLLEELGGSLLVTTYQAGKVIVVRSVQERLSSLLRSFDQPMGLACDQGRLAVGIRGQIWFWRDVPALAPQIDPAGRHDACFVPRACHVTGDIRVHELAWGGEDLWVVNTRFSCLCTLHGGYSFVPRWRPPFVTALAAEDRCHLNGLAMAAGRPKYVTALGQTDTREGWRPNKHNGGCVIDVSTGAVVARGLCMPHSPRLHEGKLWVLDSGTGRVLILDLASGQAETVAALPGYTRGLAFRGRYAFVGLSRIRETKQFGGLPIAAATDLKCGVWVLDAATGRQVAFLEFEEDVEEIFDVQVMAGFRRPNVIGLQQETVHAAFCLPAGSFVPKSI